MSSGDGDGDGDEGDGSSLCCPHCGTVQDAFEVYTHSADGDKCLGCGEHVDDDDWIHD